MNELEQVKTKEECIEMATVDCHDEDECLAGWEACLSDILSEVKEVKVAGEIWKLNEIAANRRSLTAVCEKNKKKIKLSLDSIELINPTQAQKLWISAWLEWSASL